jgi:hypothetical protein
VEPQLLRFRVRRPEPIAHDTRPEPARRAELGDLLEEVIVRVEEKGEPLANGIDIETGINGRLRVGARMRKRERQLLCRRGAGLANVIPAHGDRIPSRHLASAEPYHVGDQPKGRARRIDERATGDVFLEDVILHGARQRLERRPVPFRDRRIQR